MNHVGIIVAAVLISLAIVFHGLSNRFEFVRLDESGGFRIDRLTGNVTLCGVGGGKLQCISRKEP